MIFCPRYHPLMVVILSRFSVAGHYSLHYNLRMQSYLTVIQSLSICTVKLLISRMRLYNA